MKILFLEGDMSRKGGTERMTSILSNAFCKEHQVFVISLKLNNENVFFKLDPSVEHVCLSQQNGKLGIIKQILEIRKFVVSHSIDWIINVDVGMGFYGIFAAKNTSANVLTWEHGNFYNNWGSRIFPYLRKFAAKHSDAMVVLTEKDKSNYLSNIKTKRPIYIIPNPVEQHIYSYNSESKIILSAGLLLPIKGYDKAIEVASKVLPRHPDWKWVICGDGPEKNHLEHLIEKYHLQGQVVLLGTVNDMEEQYKKAAIYVMTSKMEGLPMVLLEAKSWGLPIISFDIMTGPSDIIQDGLNGYLVEADNIEKMVVKLEQLIADDTLREKFSQNASVGIDKFEFNNVILKWKEILSEE